MFSINKNNSKRNKLIRNNSILEKEEVIEKINRTRANSGKNSNIYIFRRIKKVLKRIDKII